MDTDTRNRFVTLTSMIAQNWKYYVLLNRFFQSAEGKNLPSPLFTPFQA